MDGAIYQLTAPKTDVSALIAYDEAYGAVSVSYTHLLHNGGNPDAATPREGRRSSDCKLLSSGKIMTVPEEEAPANYVPAAAVIPVSYTHLDVYKRQGMELPHRGQTAFFDFAGKLHVLTSVYILFASAYRANIRHYCTS